jgi:hypothetical protein
MTHDLVPQNIIVDGISQTPARSVAAAVRLAEETRSQVDALAAAPISPSFCSGQSSRCDAVLALARV